MNRIHIIQQWDYYHKDKAGFLNEHVMKYCSGIGVTSLQSYVYWASIEKEKGIFDFSFYDKIVQKMRQYGLKWTPFIILGPSYSLPDWFLKSGESVPAVCAEHNQASNIESIWNPHLPKYVNGFLKAIAEHFDPQIIESVIIGVSGNWGESLYPIAGGFTQKGEVHCHPGLWGNDPYARKSFEQFLERKYQTIDELNSSWGKNYKNFEDAEYGQIPFIGEGKHQNPFQYYYDRILDKVTQKLNIRDLYLKHEFSFLTPQIIAHKTDTMTWYLDSMTNYVDQWLKMTRNYFPDNKINIVTGGDGNPYFGADFTDQMKKAIQYNAGIRITNQDDNYLNSFVLTRWVASTAHHYDSYFTTEEALFNNIKGTVMRLFDIQSSGGDGVYYKALIELQSHGTCQAEPSGPGECGDAMKQYPFLLQKDKPIIKTAILLSTTCNRLYRNYIALLYQESKLIRREIDFYFLCETMISDNALNDYHYLIIPFSTIITNETHSQIVSWQKNGGKLILGSKSSLYNIQMEKFPITKDISYHAKKIPNIAEMIMPELIVYKKNKDPLYFSQFKDRILFYNESGYKNIKIQYNNKYQQIDLNDFEIKEYFIR